MMDIDWDNAPEWAEVYIIDTIGGHDPGFHKSKGNAWEDASGKFWEKGLSYLKVIPRPTRPAAPKWMDGLPSIGERCEVSVCSQKFMVFEVRGFYNEMVWLSGHGVGQIVENVSDCQFRPIRTKEQREREELEKILRDVLERPLDLITERELASVIIAAGYRKQERD